MKNVSLAQQSNDVSSTKEYSNAMNTYINQYTPSGVFPTYSTKIQKERKINKDIIHKNLDFQNNIQDLESESISGYPKFSNKKIVFNSAKSFSSKPRKYFSNFQKSTKMKIIELNSNSKNTQSCKEKYLYNSLHHTLCESKITPRVINTQKNDNFSNRRNKISNKPMNKSSKIFFSNSQGFSGFSKSFHKKFESNRKSQHSYNNVHNLNSSYLRNSKSIKNISRSSSLRNYTYYLNPTNKQYLGIDLNLVSNSSNRINGEINSQTKRYSKNYNYNNDDENDNSNVIIDYDLKSNDNYFFPKHTENDEENHEIKNKGFMLTESNIYDKINNISNLKSKSYEKGINGQKNEKVEDKNIINLNINKDISEIRPSIKEDEFNKKNSNIKKESLNQFINKPSSNKLPLSKKLKKEEFINSLTNIHPFSHFENGSMNEINRSTPISSFQMCPYEAESSPTNYIKSSSNINNFTYLTNNNDNNSKTYNKNNNIINNITKEQSDGQSYHSINKSKRDEKQQKSYSHLNLNQSELINNINTSNSKISEKDEEKRIAEKLEYNHKLRRNKKKKGSDNKNIDINELNNNYDTHNTIEEKDEESEYLDKINNNLLSKEKNKKRDYNKSSDLTQQSQESLFQESELINETKKILDKNDNKINKFVKNNDNKKKEYDLDDKEIKRNNNQKKYDSVKTKENEEEKEIMERLTRLRKEKEKNEEIYMKEKILKQLLEEEKIKSKLLEEERKKKLNFNEEERMKNVTKKEERRINILETEEEEKIKEFENIKNEIKYEQQQRNNLEKDPQLFGKRNNSNQIIEKKNIDLLCNNSYNIILSSNKSNKYINKKLNNAYILLPNKIKNIKFESKNNNDMKTNNKDNILDKKIYLNNENHINSGKYTKQYITGGLEKVSYNYNYNYDYGSNTNIEKEIFDSNIIKKYGNNIYNTSNNLKNKIFNKNYNYFSDNKNYNTMKIKEDNIIENNDFKILSNRINNKPFIRNNSQTQFQFEIIYQENKKKYNMKNSFNSFNFKINGNNTKINNRKSNKNIIINYLNDDSYELNINNGLKNKNIKNENLLNSINNNSNMNNSTITQRLIDKINNTRKKNISTQNKEYDNSNIKDNNLDKNNNLYLKNYISNVGQDNDIKSEYKNSFLDYSKNINQNINSTLENNENKNKVLFDYEKFKNQYIKLNSNKKLNRTLSNIDGLFDRNNLNFSIKKINEQSDDFFYKTKKMYIDLSNIIDNKKKMYNKIPHHIKNERNRQGLWADFSMNNNTIGMTDQSSSFYTINNSNKNNKYKFNRKINTSVLPANPFDTVNKAKEFFFFND